MRRFRRHFAGWCAAMALFLVAANLAGTVRDVGLRPFRTTGFPFTVAGWGYGVEEFFDWSALALNVAVAAVVAPLVALLCAASRSWAESGTGPGPSAAEELLARAARLDRAGSWDEAAAVYAAVLTEPGYGEYHEYARNCLRVIERKKALAQGPA